LERLKTRQQMVAALLAHAGPLSWQQLHEGLCAAGAVLPKGEESLRRAWKRDPLFHLDGEGLLHLRTGILLADGSARRQLVEARLAAVPPRELPGVVPLSERELQELHPKAYLLPSWSVIQALALHLPDAGGSLPDLLGHLQAVGWPLPEAKKLERDQRYFLCQDGQLVVGPGLARLRRDFRDSLRHRQEERAQQEWLSQQIETYSRQDPASQPEVLFYCLEPKGQVCWRIAPGGKVQRGPIESLKPSLRQAELIVGRNPTEVLAQVGLTPRGRLWVDLEMGGHGRSFAASTLGRQPEGLADLEEFYEYGRSHGYLLDQERRYQVDWNPLDQLDLASELCLQLRPGSTYRLLLTGIEGPVWSDWRVTRIGCYLSGPGRQQVDLGDRVYELQEVLRVEIQPER